MTATPRDVRSTPSRRADAGSKATQEPSPARHDGTGSTRSSQLRAPSRPAASLAGNQAVQRELSSAGSGDGARGIDAVAAGASGGEPLEPATRKVMESRFGHDFGSVRVHANAWAARTAAEMNARAFTVGSHIVFGSSAYAPNTPRGRHLLAHELAHVVQQAGAPAGNDDLQRGRVGDKFEHEAGAAARAVLHGERPSVTPAPNTAPGFQKQDLNINDFDPNDISPTTAVADPDYIDNGLMDAKLRTTGSVFSPVFTGFTIFYADGTIMDIPAAANSAFPAFSPPPAAVMTIFRRHITTGRIFPITLLQSDFFAGSGNTAHDKETTALAAHAQFLFYRRLCGNINTLFTNALLSAAFAYSGLVAQMWNVGLGARGAVQIFTMTGALRAMAAGRAAAAGAAAKAGAGAAGGTASRQALVHIERSALKAGTFTTTEQQAIASVETRLTSITQRAIQSVNSGTATGPWAQRLAGMQPTDSMYRLTLGNAIHEEAFEIARQEVRAGTLPLSLQSNVGRAIPGSGLPNSYGGLRPDFRLPLSSGNEAVWDITTVAQAGHAQPYTSFSWVQYVVELLY